MPQYNQSGAKAFDPAEIVPGEYSTWDNYGVPHTFLCLTRGQILMVDNENICLFDNPADLGMIAPKGMMERFPFDHELNEDEQIVSVMRGYEDKREVWYVYLNDDTLLMVTEDDIRKYSSFANCYKAIDEGAISRVYNQFPKKT